MEQANETGLDRFVPNVRFEKIPIKDLYANQQYQRNLSETAILKMVEDFDIFQINPVKVSVRDSAFMAGRDSLCDLRLCKRHPRDAGCRRQFAGQLQLRLHGHSAFQRGTDHLQYHRIPGKQQFRDRGLGHLCVRQIAGQAGHFRRGRRLRFDDQVIFHND